MSTTTAPPVHHEIDPAIYHRRWAILAVLCNMLADISYAALDPRIRVGS